MRACQWHKAPSATRSTLPRARSTRRMHLVEAELLSALAEDKEHGINDVGLATAVGPHNRREPLQAREGKRGVNQPSSRHTGVRNQIVTVRARRGRTLLAAQTLRAHSPRCCNAHKAAGGVASRVPRRAHLVERPDLLHARIGLEVFERHVRDDQAGARRRACARFGAIGGR